MFFNIIYSFFGSCSPQNWTNCQSRFECHSKFQLFSVHLFLSRDRAAVDGKTAESSGSDQRNYPFRFNVQIQRDPILNSHGLTLSSQTPILVQDITPGMMRFIKCYHRSKKKKFAICRSAILNLLWENYCLCFEWTVIKLMSELWMWWWWCAFTHTYVTLLSWNLVQHSSWATQ